MTAMATQTAVIITHSSSTMPTAVMTLSSENTASSTTIWTMTCQKTAWTILPCFGLWSPSRRSCSSSVPLAIRKTPPRMRMMSRPEKENVAIENSGCVSVTIQEIENSNAMRINNASVRPITRALLR